MSENYNKYNESLNIDCGSVYVADGTGGNGVLDDSGTYPNSAGYKLIYNRIKEFIKCL